MAGSIFVNGSAALVDMALKGAVVLALASAVVLAMTRCKASAAARHLVWTLSIAAALWIALGSLLMPKWTLPLASADRETTNIVSPVVALAWPELAPRSETDAATAVETSPARAETAPPAVVRAMLNESRLADPLAAPSWQTVLCAIWAVGFLIALAPALLGAVSLWRLRRRSQPVNDPEWLHVMGELARAMRLRRQVGLLKSGDRLIPLTWGIVRPIVVLPSQAEHWSAERMRSVLMHELAHVGRLDCLWQWLAQLARAAHWFNPLAWFAVRQQRLEAEHACDDRVLQTGVFAPDYADHLLAIASQCARRRVGMGAALAMARSSHLDQRLRTILAPGLNRRSISMRWAGTSAVVVMASAALLATVSIRTEAQAQEATAAKTQAKDQQKSEASSSADRIAQLRRTLLEQYVTAPNEDRVLRGAIKGMVESLGDPYSEYLPAEKLADLERQIAGKLSGIGAQLEMRDGAITIVTPLEGSPALAAGLRPGDTVVDIDGESAEKLKLEDAVKRILGAAGSKVALKVRRASGETADLAVQRGPIVLRTVTGFGRASHERWQYFIDREHQIGYIAVSQLGPRTPDELKETIGGLKKAGLKGLILDLRDSPGGLLDAAYETAQLFLGEATVVTIRGRDGEAKQLKSDGSKRLGDWPLVVLASERTASAAEILTGALKDNQRAVVVGTRTFGKGSVQSLIKLDDDGGAIRLTTAYFETPGGRTIDRRPDAKSWGVDPNDGYFVPMTQEAAERLHRRHQEQQIIGGRPRAEQADDESRLQSLLKDDAQLAAALRTLVAKIVSGEFEQVGQSAAAAQEYALRRAEIDTRRASLTRSLQQLEREWQSLGVAH